MYNLALLTLLLPPETGSYSSRRLELAHPKCSSNNGRPVTWKGKPGTQKRGLKIGEAAFLMSETVSFVRFTAPPRTPTISFKSTTGNARWGFQALRLLPSPHNPPSAASHPARAPAFAGCHSRTAIPRRRRRRLSISKCARSMSVA